MEGFESVDAYPVLEQLKEPVIIPTANGYKKAGGLFDEAASINIENPNDAGEIRFTLDGSMPSINSELADNPIKVNMNTVLKSAVFNDGKISSMIAEGYFRIKSKVYKKPIRYEIFYLENLSFLPSLANTEPDATGMSFEIASDELHGLIKNNTAVRFTSQIEIDQADTYTFYTRSDDGSKLFIDDLLVVDNDGDHGVKENDGKMELQSGPHDLEVVWFNGVGDGWLDIYIESANMPKQILPTTLLKSK